jgi:palmitoyltransferase
MQKFCLIMSYCPCATAAFLFFGVFSSYFQFFCFDVLWSGGHRVLFGYSVIMGVFLFGMILTSFYRAIFTCPGYIDEEVWQSPPHVLTTEDDIETVRAALLGKVNPNIVMQHNGKGAARMCKKCNVYKPDGSHHCSDCQHCVLRMDHHCPWINNCVGERNEKFFILFISYIPLGSLHIVGTAFFAYHNSNVWSKGALGTHMLNVAVALFAGTVGVALLFFALFHLFLLVENETTIDRRIAALSGRTQAPQPYWMMRLCCRVASFKQTKAALSVVFGDDVTMWAFPVAPTWKKKHATILV